MLQRYHASGKGASGAFELLPAIDLRAGRVVRLSQGDFRRETSYSDDPIGVARDLVERGATWLHVVDLDGAKDGQPAQSELIGRIARAVEDRARCQVAGGLRSEAAVDAALAAGAARVVVGTAALRDSAFAARAVAHHGADRIVVALDVRDGLALGEGWRAGARGVSPADALNALADQGVSIFAATAIDRDGLLRGPDLTLLSSLVGLGRGRIVASGGIGSIDDLRRVREIGCVGAIVGKALYEGRIDLVEALKAMTD